VTFEIIFYHLLLSPASLLVEGFVGDDIQHPQQPTTSSAMTRNSDPLTHGLRRV